MRSISVVAVGFAPVKSMRHTTYPSLTLDRHGPVGDRMFCWVDIAARRVLRTVANPALVAAVARWDGSVLEVVLPSGESASAPSITTGESIVCDYWGRSVSLSLLDGPHATLVSSYLGRAVRLAAAPRGEVVYAGQVSVVTTDSLRALADRAGRPDLAGESARFRATLVLDTPGEPWMEDAWPGRELLVGSARIRIGSPVPRCAVIDVEPFTGRPDSGLLKALVGVPGRRSDKSEGPCFGVDARVVEAGVVRPGDLARLAD